MRAEELPGEAHVNGAPPVFRLDILDAASRPSDPGVVDQRIESAQGGFDIVE